MNTKRDRVLVLNKVREAFCLEKCIFYFLNFCLILLAVNHKYSRKTNDKMLELYRVVSIFRTVVEHGRLKYADISLLQN